MNTRLRARVGVWARVALPACMGLALLHTATSQMWRRADTASWHAAYYATWAALTPFIFTLARRVPVRRDRWARPLVFHLAVSVVVSLCAPAALEVAFATLVVGGPPPGLHEVLWRVHADV